MKISEAKTSANHLLKITSAELLVSSFKLGNANIISQIGLVVNSRVFETLVRVLEFEFFRFSKVKVLVCPSFTKIGSASVTSILFGRTAIAFCSPSENEVPFRGFRGSPFATILIIIEETLLGTFSFQIADVFPFASNEKDCSLLYPETAVN